jgi:hypothetical protein
MRATHRTIRTKKKKKKKARKLALPVVLSKANSFKQSSHALPLGRVEMVVRVGLRDALSTQPAEVCVARRAVHLVATVHL